MEKTSVINNTLSAIHSLSVNDTSKKEDDPFWVLLMDRSQLVMTLIGVIANTVTTITLIKNREVCQI